MKRILSRILHIWCFCVVSYIGFTAIGLCFLLTFGSRAGAEMYTYLMDLNRKDIKDKVRMME